MDRVNRYRNLIKQYINDYAIPARNKPYDGIETLAVIDEANDQYMLVNVGWRNGKREENISLFARIKDGKVWIEDDWTQDGLGNILVEAGVPKEEIVLAFLSPREREMSEYAVA